MWMEQSTCGIGVVSMTMRVESFERGIELSGEREKLTSSSTFNVRITAPAARSANATAKTSDWRL